MAKNSTCGAAVSPNASPPVVYLRDEQIEKYMGEGFDDLKMHDVASKVFRCKVVGLSKREEPEYDEKNCKPTGKSKIHRSVDLEILETEPKKSETGADKALKKLGQKADY